MADPTAPTPGQVYFDGVPISEYVVDDDFSFVPDTDPEGADAATTLRSFSRTVSFAPVAAGRAFAVMAIELDYATRLWAVPRLVLRKNLLGHRLTPTERLIARRTVIRARGWRHRQLARLADEHTPVGSLVKPSARRAGRRAHRRSAR